MLQQEVRDRPKDMRCICNGELHKLIRERINRNFFPSLQTLAANYILDHIELYSGNEGMSPHSVKSLTDNARQSLLERLKAQNLSKMKIRTPDNCTSLVDRQNFQKMFATFQQLVVPKCKEFNLEWLLKFCPDPDKLFFVDKVLNILALEAPLLESLVVSYGLCVVVDGHLQQHAWRNSSVRLRLFSLHSLKSLKMPGYSLLPEDLILIGEQLPKLELLLCDLLCDEISQLQDATVTMIANLDNFKHFIFDKVPPLYQHEIYFTFCFNNFPQLHTIGLYDHEFFRTEFKPIRRQLTRLLFCGETDLQMLQSVISNNLMPNVSHLLTTSCHGQAWDPMLLNLATSFPNISKLTLKVIGNERRFLMAYGPNLLKLTLITRVHDPLDITLEELVKLCPKLKELCLNCCQGPAPAILLHPEHHTLDSLIHLELGWNLPFPIDSLLMIAPNIERLSFCAVQPSSEIKKLIKLIKGKMVCQKLVSLEVFLDLDSEDPGIPVAFYELVKVMCTYVPTLEELNLGVYVRNADLDRGDIFIEEDSQDSMTDCVNNFCLRKCLQMVNSVHGKNRL